MNEKIISFESELSVEQLLKAVERRLISVAHSYLCMRLSMLAIISRVKLLLVGALL